MELNIAEKKLDVKWLERLPRVLNLQHRELDQKDILADTELF